MPEHGRLSASPALAYVALGANLGDREETLTRTEGALRTLPHTTLLRSSGRRETEALLPPENATPQPRYLNAVVELETALTVDSLFAVLKQLEVQLGRTPAARWAPRVIDLDLLFYGDQVVDTPLLQVPHPRLHQRRFVLEPLVELAPTLVHPVLRSTMTALLAALPPER